MANVKFNRGTVDQASKNTADALAFLAKGSSGTPTTAGDYGYLYLGTQMVATKYLKELDTTGLTVATSSNDKLLGFAYDSASSMSTFNIIKSTQLSGYTPADTDFMTAAAVSSFVGGADKYHTAGGWNQGDPALGWNVYTLAGQNSAADINITIPLYDGNSTFSGVTNAFVTPAQVATYVGNTDKYHTTGSWGSSTNWNVYTATAVNNADALAFTLPVASTFTNSDDSHLVTPKAIADYFAGLEGGMRYCGGLSSTTLPTSGDTGYMGPYKGGDVFIASSAFTIGTGTTVKVEVGDMIVLKGTGPITTLSTSNCDVFERNLDGAVHVASNLTADTVILGAGTDSIKSLANGTQGQMLQMGSSAPAWADYVYDTVALKTNTIDTIQVTRYTNGTAGTPTDIQIQAVNIKQTATTANEDRPILVTASTSPTSGNAAEINYESSVKINASTGTLKASEVTLSDGTNTVNVLDTLVWHTLPTA